METRQIPRENLKDHKVNRGINLALSIALIVVLIESIINFIELIILNPDQGNTPISVVWFVIKIILLGILSIYFLKDAQLFHKLYKGGSISIESNKIKKHKIIEIVKKYGMIITQIFIVLIMLITVYISFLGYQMNYETYRPGLEVNLDCGHEVNNSINIVSKISNYGRIGTNVSLEIYHEGDIEIINPTFYGRIIPENKIKNPLAIGPYYLEGSGKIPTTLTIDVTETTNNFNVTFTYNCWGNDCKFLSRKSYICKYDFDVEQSLHMWDSSMCIIEE